MRQLNAWRSTRVGGAATSLAEQAPLPSFNSLVTTMPRIVVMRAPQRRLKLAVGRFRQEVQLYARAGGERFASIFWLCHKGKPKLAGTRIQAIASLLCWSSRPHSPKNHLC